MNPLRPALLILIVAALLLGQTGPAAAQDAFALEIFNAVNALRASRGLAPYNWDAGLASYALQHCQYMISSGNLSHVHSDGSLPWQNGIQENIAMGSTNFMNAAVVINSIWSDEIHMKPMIGYSGGAAGVGVAYSGGNVYVTFDMRPAGVSVSTSTPTGIVTSAPGTRTATSSARVTSVTPTPPVPLSPRQTSTSNPDGSVMHVVGYGQTLVTIAQMYGVTVDDIRRMNNMAAGSSAIYAGQKLLIRPPQPAIATPTITATPLPSATPTEEPSPTAAATATRLSPNPSATPTPPAAAEPMSTRQVALLIFGLLALGGAVFLAVQTFPRLRR